MSNDKITLGPTIDSNSWNTMNSSSGAVGTTGGIYAGTGNLNPWASISPSYTGTVGYGGGTGGIFTYTSANTVINSPLVIDYNGTRIDVGQAITMLMDRLCIIMPSIELHDKYPALREAYEAYKSLEALCKTGEKDE